MLIEEMAAAIREKEELLQRMRVEMQRIEKDIDTLKAASRILEQTKHNHGSAADEVPSNRSAVPETIRKAFP